MTTLSELWVDDQGQDIAEYAVMLAAILVIVIGTIRLIGSNANNAFSAVASSAPIEGLCWRLKVFEGSCASVLQNAVWSMHREQSRHFGDERALRSQFRSVAEPLFALPKSPVLSKPGPIQPKPCHRAGRVRRWIAIHLRESKDS